MPEGLNVRTPLFDRLAGGQRTLDRDGLRQSVRRELELLFNTRSSFPAHRLAGAPLTVIDYGIPPLTDFSARNPNDHETLATALRTAIETFEPRLASVRVQIIPPEDDSISLTVTIQAELIIDTVREPVSFVAGVDFRQGTVRIDARA
jgi:type VI secretion system lysozyme-like protein